MEDEKAAQLETVSAQEREKGGTYHGGQECPYEVDGGREVRHRLGRP